MNRTTLDVVSIFRSIQGEGTAQGIPCSFVRLAGCNLRCSYCDTPEALGAGRPMTIAAILSELRSHACHSVNVTGGEPLLQESCADLLRGLVRLGKKTILETNGSLPLRGIPRGVRTVLDIKCPSSGMCDRNRYANLDLLRPGDEIKFVLSNREDYEWAARMIWTRRFPPACTILFSPAWKVLNPASLAEWILDDDLPVRLNIQLHKVIWGECDEER